ncbi:MAG: pantetheine-phosphate adenylyltransferase [Azoarcus sp.]|jgi:pantetheine-phosphate adenylyltransferase|nr:pantetheine-phosphate adenylyltransferase [Azoarcus sp.]
MTGTVVVYPGTFDPLTQGHEDIVRRAAALFGHVVVAVAASRRDALFPLAERVAIAAEVLQPLANVEVVGFDTLLADFVRARGAKIVVRGVRTVADFEYEAQLATMNRKLYPDLETVFLTPSEKYSSVSATIVREIARHGGEVGQFVPAAVVAHLQRKF